MALSLSESKELEELKQKHKKECYEHQEKLMRLEHEQKMARLEKCQKLYEQIGFRFLQGQNKTISEHAQEALEKGLLPPDTS